MKRGRIAVLLGLGLLGCGEPEAPWERACAVEAPVLFPGQRAPELLVNAYYLQEEAARDVRAGRVESASLEETLAKASALGVKVVRAAAFNDGAEKRGDSAIQLAPGEYDELSLQGLDRVLARAAAAGVKLILPLGNHWDAYGGARRYVGWAGLAEPTEGDPRFYLERLPIELFKAHLRTLLSRVNTVDGIRYGDHPAVYAWELLNEPRLPRALDPEGALLADWVDELAAEVKQLAPTHLVGTGEEGFDALDDEYWRLAAPHVLTHGGSFRRNTSSPWIDFGSVHLYPEQWDVPPELLAETGARWIHDHALLARELGKPLVVGEFGLSNLGALTLDERRAVYRAWLRCAKNAGAAAVGPWLFAYDSRPDAWDAYTFYYRDGTLPDDPVNRYADLLVEAARP